MLCVKVVEVNYSSHLAKALRVHCNQTLNCSFGMMMKLSESWVCVFELQLDESINNYFIMHIFSAISVSEYNKLTYTEYVFR